HSFCRSAQPVADCPFAGAEGVVTLATDEALLLLRMDTNIAPASLASRMATRIGAEYRCGVHDAPPGCAWKTLPREVWLDPRLLYNCTAPRFGVELPFVLMLEIIGTCINDEQFAETGKGVDVRVPRED